MQSQRFVVFAIVLAAFLSLKPSLKALTPGQSFDLSHWKLTLPVDNQGGIIGQAAEIRNPVLQDYSSEFFYIGADGAMTGYAFVSLEPATLR